MRRLFRSSVLAASVLAAFALPASAPALANVPGQYLLVVNSGFTNEDILGQCHNNVMQLRGPTGDFWQFINPHTWSNLSGQNVTVWEVQAAPGAGCDAGLCWNYAAGYIFLDSCVSSDTAEWFWQDPTGSSTNGAQNFWYINADASAHSNPREYIYVTAASYQEGSPIEGSGPGQGGLAAWNRPCEVNC